MLNPLSNPFYLLPPLIAAAACLGVAAYVWRRASRSPGKLMFCVYVLCVAGWSALIFLMRSSPDQAQALAREKTMVVAYYLMFILFFHFTVSYASVTGRASRVVLGLSYALAATVAVLAPTDLLIRAMRVEPYGYAPVLGPLVPPLSAMGFMLMGGGAYNLVRRYRQSRSYEERNRTAYLVLLLSLPIIGGLLDAFTNLPPIAIWANLAFCVLGAVVIARYHLWDIRVVVRRGLVYLLVSGVVAIPYVGMIYLVYHWLEPRLTPWWLLVVLVLLLAFALRPLYGWAQTVVDRSFYRDRYDYLRALQGFSREAHSIVSLDELSSTITGLVQGALRSASACLLLTSEDEGGLRIVSCTRLPNPPADTVFRSDSPLVRWLERHQRILTSTEFEVVPQLQSLSLKERTSAEQLGGELYVPIATRQGQLIGILVAGPKLSEQAYSDEEKELLASLSRHMALALENARLYRDALHARENLETWFNSMPDCVVIVGTDYSIEFMNRAAKERFGEKTGRQCWSGLGKEGLCLACPVQDYLRGVMSGTRYNESIGDRDYDIAAAPLLDPDGHVSVIEVLRYVTELKNMEKRILASLNEKEVLLKGIHHRVKNNMQIVHSLLSLQGRYVMDERDAELFRESQNRVRSMALVHERLYQSEDLAVIDFGRYVDELLKDLQRSYAVEDRVSVRVEIAGVTLGIDQAVPCGLIINELVSNSLLHAFPNGRRGEVRIGLRKLRGSEVALEVSDDGVGLPESVDFRNTETLGLQLIAALAERQLDGTIRVDRSRGTRFEITFEVARQWQEHQS